MCFTLTFLTTFDCIGHLSYTKNTNSSSMLDNNAHDSHSDVRNWNDLEVGWRWNGTRCWSRIWWNLLSVVYTTPEKFEHTPSFLRWGLPFTLISHNNRAFQKRSSNRRNLETPALRFSVDLKTVNGRRRGYQKSCDFSEQVLLNPNFKWRMIVAFAVWTRPQSGAVF